MNSAIKDAVARLRSAGVVGWWDLQGFSEREIMQLCSRFGRPLPPIYLDYLRTMGHRAGRFAEGTDLFFPSVDALLHLQEWARECAAPSGFHFPENAFVFGTHEDYSFGYFPADDRLPDPPVYFWLSGKQGFSTKKIESFSQWLSHAVDDQLNLENSKGS